jgi:glutamate dehydrogenase/leucine dehydrogenase
METGISRFSALAVSTAASSLGEFTKIKGRNKMKIIVVGGSGLIGSKLVTKLLEHGHKAVAASPSSGVNTLTGEGLAEALKGASVVVDVSNSPSFEDAAALKFFETSTRNLLTYERPQAWDITLRCRLWELSASPNTATSAQKPLRRS